jgi:hypothetical protein
MFPDKPDGRPGSGCAAFVPVVNTANLTGVIPRTALVGQHSEHIRDVKPDGRHREEVDRCQALDVMLEEGAPRLRGRPSVAHHVLAHAGLTDVETELEQFAVNAR